MRQSDVRAALGLSGYENVWTARLSKKNKALWLKRGYKSLGSWNVFSWTMGRIIVRAWRCESNGVLLLEVIYTTGLSTEWYIWYDKRWRRFSAKCEAEQYYAGRILWRTRLN